MNFFNRLCDVFDAVIDTTGAEEDRPLLPIGFVQKKIKYNILLSPGGEFLTAQPLPEEEQLCAIPSSPQAEGRASKKSECQFEKLPGRRLCHLPKQPRPEAAPHRDIGIAQLGNIPHNEKIAGIHRQRLHAEIAPMHREGAKLRLHLYDALVKAADLLDTGYAQPVPVFQYDVLRSSPLGLSRHTITSAQDYAGTAPDMT